MSEGKWPLSTTTTESEEILAIASEKGVKHIVGLQRRFSPSSRYWHDLIKQGYVGKTRAVRMSVGVDAFGEVMPEFAKCAVDVGNFTELLSISGGHFHDMLFKGVGFPQQLAAVIKNQFSITTIAETGKKIPYIGPHEVMIISLICGPSMQQERSPAGSIWLNSTATWNYPLSTGRCKKPAFATFIPTPYGQTEVFYLRKKCSPNFTIIVSFFPLLMSPSEP